MGLRLRYNSHQGKGKFIFKYWNDLKNEGGENNEFGSSKKFMVMMMLMMVTMMVMMVMTMVVVMVMMSSVLDGLEVIGSWEDLQSQRSEYNIKPKA